MNKITLFFTGLLFLLISCKPNKKEESTFRITGKATDISSLYAVVRHDSCSFYLDTISVGPDSNFSFNGKADTLMQVDLYTDQRKPFPSLYLRASDSLHLVLKKDTLVDMSGDTINTPVFKFMQENNGTVAWIRNYRDSLEAGKTIFRTQSDSVENRFREKIQQFVQEREGTPAALILMKENLELISDTLFVRNQLANYPKNSPETFLVKQINEYLRRLNFPEFNKKMPPVYFYDEENKRFSLNETLDSFTVITCWATWDSLSVEHVKELRQLADRFANRPLEFISISFDTDKALWKEKVKEYRIPGRNYRFADGFTNETVKKLGIRTLPANLVSNTRVLLVNRDIYGTALKAYLDKEVPASKKK